MRISDWSSDVCSSDLAGKAREAGDRPLVVDDVEDDRRIIDGREGQRRVEIALGRRAFAAPDGRDSAVALRGRGHRPAYRLRILRCQIARYAEESMFGRRIHDRQLSPEQMVAEIRIELVNPQENGQASCRERVCKKV